MPEKAKKLKLSDFYTVPAAEKGRKVPLALPDGTPTEFYLVVIGADAPAAKNAKVKLMVALQGLAAKEASPELDLQAELERMTLDYRCALVIAGKLPGGFSADATRSLLANNPSTAEMVETISTTPGLFFAPAS